MKLLRRWGPRQGYQSFREKSVSEVDNLGSPGFWFCFLYCLVSHTQAIPSALPAVIDWSQT